MTTTIQQAPAKINLTLHVTGRRDDGYHLLDSLVVFTALGDQVQLSPGPLSLAIDGPFAEGLPVSDDNLCLRAARLQGRDVAIRLTKNLPVASGIGGGSADAAAVLRGLGASAQGTEKLGADVPVCMVGKPVRMRGVGELLEPLPPLPDFHMVLVNPGQGLSTPQVFGALDRRANAPMPKMPAWPDLGSFVDYLARCRNDLEPPATQLLPVIGECIAALQGAGAALARMSGSGATCFGIFPDAASAKAAADAVLRPGWWVRATGLAPAQGLG